MPLPQQLLVSCNGGESYAAIVRTPNGEISVHAEDNGEIIIFLTDNATLPHIRIVDASGHDRFFPDRLT